MMTREEEWKVSVLVEDKIATKGELEMLKYFFNDESWDSIVDRVISIRTDFPNFDAYMYSDMDDEIMGLFDDSDWFFDEDEWRF